MDADVIVVGGGVVGAALAFGALLEGKRVLLADGDDNDLRASRANFGLVWVQGKGANSPDYSFLTRESADLWPDFLAQLNGVTLGNIDYSRPGGLIFCLSENEFDTRDELNRRMHNQIGKSDARMVERVELERMLPDVQLGPDVVGASYCALDGHANPLQLLAALHTAILKLGGQIQYRCKIDNVRPVSGGGFTVTSCSGETFEAPKVIVAAGLATSELTADLDLDIPLRSERGQLLVTERLEPILPFPGSGLRQTADGTVMIGATKEDVADRGVTVDSATVLARRAMRILPALSSVRLVRQWSGFRVMPLDGVPIYSESGTYPGLFAAACHSGVTLAAAHALIVAPIMLKGQLSQRLSVFSNGRFNVQNCA